MECGVKLFHFVGWIVLWFLHFLIDLNWWNFGVNSQNRNYLRADGLAAVFCFFVGALTFLGDSVFWEEMREDERREEIEPVSDSWLDWEEAGFRFRRLTVTLLSSNFFSSRRVRLPLFGVSSCSDASELSKLIVLILALKNGNQGRKTKKNRPWTSDIFFFFLLARSFWCDFLRRLFRFRLSFHFRVRSRLRSCSTAHGFSLRLRFDHFFGFRCWTASSSSRRRHERIIVSRVNAHYFLLIGLKNL